MENCPELRLKIKGLTEHFEKQINQTLSNYA